MDNGRIGQMFNAWAAFAACRMAIVGIVLPVRASSFARLAVNDRLRDVEVSPSYRHASCAAIL